MIDIDERFVVDNDQKANWALQKIGQLRSKIEKNKQLAEDELFRINTWLEEVNKPLENSISYFTSLLEEYHKTAHPDEKTIKLPYGTMCIRKQQPQFKRDDELLLKWLDNVGKEEYIKVKRSPLWGELKKICKVAGNKLVDIDTGEVVEGVEVIEREPRFSISP